MHFLLNRKQFSTDLIRLPVNAINNFNGETFDKHEILCKIVLMSREKCIIHKTHKSYATCIICISSTQFIFISKL